MKKNKWSVEKIISILKENKAGVPASELCRKHGMSDPEAHSQNGHNMVTIERKSLCPNTSMGFDSPLVTNRNALILN